MGESGALRRKGKKEPAQLGIRAPRVVEMTEAQSDEGVRLLVALLSSFVTRNRGTMKPRNAATKVRTPAQEPAQEHRCPGPYRASSAG